MHLPSLMTKPPRRSRLDDDLLDSTPSGGKYGWAALRWHGRLCREVDVSLEEAQATLAALVLLAGERKGNAAFALADLLSRRGWSVHAS